MCPMLKENSNILKFANDYHFLETGYNELGDYSRMWRLYDMDYIGNLDDFPENFSLRKEYKEYLKTVEIKVPLTANSSLNNKIIY